MKKILYFDDDPFLSDIIGSAFKKNSFELKHYSKPPEKTDDLIKLVLQENPDIIISDIYHPHIHGFEMLKILKGNQETAKFPFVFFTNHDTEEEKEEAENLGALAYFITVQDKPDEFVEKIKDLIEKNQQ